jgi:hypothetical protein
LDKKTYIYEVSNGKKEKEKEGAHGQPCLVDGLPFGRGILGALFKTCV